MTQEKEELTEYEKAMMNGIVLRRKKETIEATLSATGKKKVSKGRGSYKTGLHGSSSAKVKAMYKEKKKNRKSQRKQND